MSVPVPRVFATGAANFCGSADVTSAARVFRFREVQPVHPTGDVRPPNITGTWAEVSDVSGGWHARNGGNVSGCFQLGSSVTHGALWGATSYAKGIKINASRSSSLYGASTTVQAPALIVLTVIKS